MNLTEKEERIYLKEVIEKIHRALAQTDESVKRHLREIKENKAYLEEHKRGMDHVEKINVRQTIDNIGLIGENAVAKKGRLYRLLGRPYFGRIDFKPSDADKYEPVYIGVHTFLDEDDNKNLIYDWRAPLSSMFYDFELGPASYETPSGQAQGDISLKRQFRIIEGEMEYMIESALNIHDEILQKELNQTSSDKMKNIIATIQRDQNAIIRNEHSKTLIIQGVAGSGKTSIALHRIAFLLYKFKDTLKSEDILILSPNKVFANYISNVLPELGEEKVDETSMEELAESIFLESIRFQSFFDQVDTILENKDTQYIERVKFKSTSLFMKKLDEYLLYLENTGFQATDLLVKKFPIPHWFIEERFKAYGRVPIFTRHNEVVRDIVQNVYKYFKYQIEGNERTEIRNAVIKMFKSYNLRQLYKDFYQWLDCPDMLKQIKGGIYEYADVFPLLYLKIRLEGVKARLKVKHLVVDEMQDYSPLQYKVLNYLFPCNKTILGDIHQAVNPFSASNIDMILGVVGKADCLTMNRSYRSTYEITSFTQRIGQNVEVEPIERHGDEPSLLVFKTNADEVLFIRQQIQEFLKGSYNSMGIVCKTQDQAMLLHGKLGELNIKVHLLNPNSVVFSNGVVVTTAHLAKGLEFDQVLVPFCTEKNFQHEADRQMLYVACTRAMHQLTLSYVGKPSHMLKG